jgi:CRP-like cAMP-binding protein
MSGPDISLVRGFPFFQGVAENDLRAVLSMARTRRVERKSAVFKQGQPAQEFFLLLHGHLKVSQTTAGGRDVIVRIVEPGEPYGIAVALGRSNYPATAIAMEESITLAWPSSAWPIIVERVPILGANALKTLGQRVQDAHTQVREISTEEVERRVAHLLLRLAKQAEPASGEEADLDFPITRREIAAMTGTTLFTVSLVISGWEQQGLVSGGRERVSIRSPARLRDIAERAPDRD